MFIIGVIVGNTAPGNQVTTFSPANNVTYRTTGDAVTVQDVTLARMEGTSMVPTLWPDNVLLMHTFRNRRQVQEGDVVLYDNSGEQSAHRVVAAYPSQNRIVVKPDNGNRKQQIDYSDIQYIVIGVLWI